MELLRSPEELEEAEEHWQQQPGELEDSRQGREFQERCKATGYETQIREDCRTVVENVCRNVTVPRTKMKIERKCSTRVRRVSPRLADSMFDRWIKCPKKAKFSDI